MSSIVSIRVLDEAQRSVWRLAREIAQAFEGLSWTLVGGLMVQVLEAERSVPSHFATGDVDAVVDVRAVVRATERAAQILLEAGFRPEIHDDGVYRFVRNGDIVDVLAPDHLGMRADITTVPPGSTLEAVGARQALNRTRLMRVDTGDGAFDLPVLSLLGAIDMKARVVPNANRSRPKHERDLARLLALEEDPLSDQAELTASERRYLRDRADLLDAAHPAWVGVDSRQDGIAALRILIAPASTTPDDLRPPTVD